MPSKPSLRQNIAALYAVQLGNYVAPLLTLPWLTRVLGPANYGRLGFCIAVTNYFILFADYGFNLSATRAIAVNANDPAARLRIFWNTVTVKALLAVAGLPVLLLLTVAIPSIASVRSLVLICYFAVAGAVLTPTWFFMGSERQSTFGRITIAARILAVPLTFLMVRSPADLPVAAAIYAAAPVVIGICCWMILIREGVLARVSIRGAGLIAALKDGWPLFLSSASMSLYTNTNTVLLGLVAGPAAVGFYSAAERVVAACQGLLTPINQSVYPRISRLMHESPAEAYLLIRRVLRYQGSLSLLLSALLCLFAPVIVGILYGPTYEASLAPLRWLAPLPFVVGLSNVFGLHTMLPLGMKSAFSRILLVAGPVNIALLLPLAMNFGAAGAASAVLLTEVLVTLAMAVSLWRLHVPIFGRYVLV